MKHSRQLRTNTAEDDVVRASAPARTAFSDGRASTAGSIQLQARMATAVQQRLHGTAQLLSTAPQLMQRKAVLQSKSSAAAQQPVIQRAVTIGTDAKAPGLVATQIADYMGDFSYALASVRAVDGQTFATLDLLKAAMPAPLTADQIYAHGAVLTVAGIGGRCNEHMTHDEVVAELRTNKSSISIADGNDQRIQILEGKTGSWKQGYVCLKYSGGQLQYWHAHHGFAVG